MSKETTCCFFGHAYTPPIEEDIYKKICEVIENDNIDTFFAGGYGDFDTQSEKMVRKAKLKYPNIKLYLVKPKMTEEINKYPEKYEYYDDIIIPRESDEAHYKAMIGIRNKWMVDNSSIVMAHLRTDYGGAYKAVKYAEKAGKKIIYVPNLEPLDSFSSLNKTKEEYRKDFELRIMISKLSWLESNPNSLSLALFG